VKDGLIIALAIVAAGFMVVWIQTARAWTRGGENRPDLFRLGVGAVTNFFDTLGIGSFATTTSIFKLRGTVRDEDIPGTLNIGHTLPTFAEAFIYMTFVDVDSKTLVALILASVVGAWFGAGVVSRWPRRKVQVGMGAALIAAAALMVCKQSGWFPGGGDLLALSTPALVVGIVGNLVLGALMTLGIGLYAPCMIMVSLLGMNPKAAFPIMMGSCAFLMPAGSLRFMRYERYDLRAALGLSIGGVPAVLVAAYLVKELPLDVVRVLVVGIVLYTAVSMLRSAATRPAAARPEPVAEETPVSVA
jgi:uncharacterized membrane protein YfcA